MRKGDMLYILGAVGIILLVAAWLWFLAGDGALKRMVTRSGIYAVCQPGGYDAVCFLDADSADGGLSCLPLSQAGGQCR